MAVARTCASLIDDPGHADPSHPDAVLPEGKNHASMRFRLRIPRRPVQSDRLALQVLSGVQRNMRPWLGGASHLLIPLPIHLNLPLIRIEREVVRPLVAAVGFQGDGVARHPLRLLRTEPHLHALNPLAPGRRRHPIVGGARCHAGRRPARRQYAFFT